MLLHPSLAPARGFNPSQGNPAGGHQPRYYLPLYAHKVPAGFPSPAEEYAEGSLDLNDYLVPDPGATTFVRVPDAALRGLGIREGDLLVVNRGRAACSGSNQLSIHTPLIALTKAQIIALGLDLGVDYSLTSSCYNPGPDGRPCGSCDAGLLRAKGFAEAGVTDPLIARYAGYA